VTGMAAPHGPGHDRGMTNGPPRHLALIPDGNRRWARARRMTPEEGHEAGIANVGRIANAAFAAGTEIVSFWWGSPANLVERSPSEVQGIVGSLERFLQRGADGLLERHGARFEAVGRWREITPSLGPSVAHAASVSGAGPHRLVLLMAYDGRDELRAAADMLRGGGADEGEFERALWTGHLPPVDLLIRTGGEPHLSAAFLLWRLANAQLAFPDALWPAFDADMLAAAYARYAATERRFGR